MTKTTKTTNAVLRALMKHLAQQKKLRSGKGNR